MAKITPTTILPYTKQIVPADTNANSVNIRNALSTAEQQKTKTIGNLVRVLNAAASYNQYIARETSGHVGTTLAAWRKRK